MFFLRIVKKSFYGFDKFRKCRYFLYRITGEIAILFNGVLRKQFLNKIEMIRSLQPLCEEAKCPNYRKWKPFAANLEK